MSERGPGRVLRVGTRGSTLATTQAGHVRDALIAAGFPAELVIVSTRGDVVMAPVERIGVGVFTQELRDALDRGDCDIAVHSYKDLPTAPDERFAPMVVPPRVDPSDVLVARDRLDFSALPQGARVGTSAPRRRSQLAALRPDLDLRPVRGNIDTRMGFVYSGELDAVVLAAAGLDRVGRGAEATHRFGPDEMLPAPAQGALAVECRASDAETIAAITTLDDPRSQQEVAAERQVLRVLEAGCTAPVGALARVEGDRLRVSAVAAAPDGGAVLRASGECMLSPDGYGSSDRDGDLPSSVHLARELGERLARELLDAGAADLLSREPVDEREPLVPVLSTTAPPTVAPDREAPERISPNRPPAD